MGVFPYGVLVRYTQFKPHLVMHLPVTNEKWLVALHLKNGIQGSSSDPWLIAISLQGDSGAMGVENCARVRVMVKHENKSWWPHST